jgi:hypothetical protein
MKEESYEWVKRIIDSCNQPFHIDCARKLVECFKERFGDSEEYQVLLDQLIAKEPMIMV